MLRMGKSTCHKWVNLSFWTQGNNVDQVMIKRFKTHPEEPSDQGLHCLPFQLHIFWRFSEEEIRCVFDDN